MTQVQLKDKLIKRIQETDNQDILEDLLKILDLDSDPNIVLNLSEEQKSAIEEGENDFKNGNYLSEEESDRQAREWLEK